MAAFALAELEFVGALRCAVAEPLEQLLEGRRDHEDEERLGHLVLDDPGALDIDLQDHVTAGLERLRTWSRGEPYQLPWTSFASRKPPLRAHAAGTRHG